MLKNDTELLTMGAENVENADNAWTCYVQGQSVTYETNSNQTGVLCHFFQVEASKLNNFECPTSFTDLELLSFENKKQVSDLPTHFLLAVKLKENEDTSDTLREVKLFKTNSSSNANNQLMQISLNQTTKLKTCTF